MINDIENAIRTKTLVSKRFILTAIILHLIRLLHMLLHENIVHEQLNPTS